MPHGTRITVFALLVALGCSFHAGAQESPDSTVPSDTTSPDTTSPDTTSPDTTSPDKASTEEASLPDVSLSESPGAEGTSADASSKETLSPKKTPPGFAPPIGFSRLDPQFDIWIDTKRNMVAVDGVVVLRAGLLEMFACPKGTKEHESIVAVNSTAQLMHTGLLAVSAIPGSPVQFYPDYKPATGTVIDVWVLWRDSAGDRHETRAQDWVRNLATNEKLGYPWVFAGSGFWTDERTGKKYYQGEAGDLICVSNFPSATLDLPIRSSDSNSERAYGALTEKIPPRGTKVRLVLIPRHAEKTSKKGAASKTPTVAKPSNVPSNPNQ